MPAQVLVDADVWTCDGAKHEALAWRDGVILATGAADEVKGVAGPDAAITSAGGATVLPGFIDAHHHASIFALYGGSMRLMPPVVTDIASLQRAIADAAARSPQGWVVVTDWDETLLAEHRAPTRDELDEAVPDRPVFALHYSCHRAVVNSRALEAVGIDRSTPDPSGGTIERGKNGVPSGVLIERAMSPVEARARASLVASDLEGFIARLARHYETLLAAGITRIADATVPADLALLYREAERRGLVTVPTVMMPVSTTGYLEVPWSALDGAPTGEVQGALEVGPVKLVFDGSPGCAMCLGWWQTAGALVGTLAMSLRSATLGPIRTTLSTSPRIGAGLRTGILLYRADEATAIVKAASERGFSVATHAVGNEATDLAIATYEKAGAAAHRIGKPRIEHASFLDRELVKRIAGVGATVVAQPHFLALPAFEHAPSIPGLRKTPLRWLLDARVTVAGSSDFPVTSFEPLEGIRSAVYRRSRAGDARETDQCISLEEAVGIYTRGSAEALGCLDRCGTLTPGKRADFIVLSARLDASSLPEIRVRQTFVGGALGAVK